ncbi:MAG: transcriptional repressor, partial [Chloroflexi bacterium]|nr:transcriptional repressor [Chloroflexota bacterium]
MLKRSRQKEAILKVLSSTTSHPTASWIYDEVRKEMPGISLGTVYRNLRLLQARGEILRLDIAGDCRRFDANTNDHYHGRCDCCGQV